MSSNTILRSIIFAKEKLMVMLCIENAKFVIHYGRSILIIAKMRQLFLVATLANTQFRISAIYNYIYSFYFFN